eukprot:364263-Chlamydomonas_euryale.AAC.6
MLDVEGAWDVGRERNVRLQSFQYVPHNKLPPEQSRPPYPPGDNPPIKGGPTAPREIPAASAGGTRPHKLVRGLRPPPPHSAARDAKIADALDKAAHCAG